MSNPTHKLFPSIWHLTLEIQTALFQHFFAEILSRVLEKKGEKFSEEGLGKVREKVEHLQNFAG
jgi:hypothetical protein